MSATPRADSSAKLKISLSAAWEKSWKDKHAPHAISDSVTPDLQSRMTICLVDDFECFVRWSQRA
jgi:hypothetical protein